MEDRTDEFKTRVAEIDAAHDQLLREWQLWFGRVLVRACRRRFMRRVIAGPMARFISYFMVRKQLLGITRTDGASAFDIAAEWIRIPVFVRMPYRIAEATDDRVVVEWDQCAVGFTDPSCLAACETSMHIDIDVVRRLGGRLVVTENLLKGAPACRFEITRL